MPDTVCRGLSFNRIPQIAVDLHQSRGGLVGTGAIVGSFTAATISNLLLPPDREGLRPIMVAPSSTTSSGISR
jgi:hypothetical protein